MFFQSLFGTYIESRKVFCELKLSERQKKIVEIVKAKQPLSGEKYLNYLIFPGQRYGQIFPF